MNQVRLIRSVVLAVALLGVLVGPTWAQQVADPAARANLNPSKSNAARGRPPGLDRAQPGKQADRAADACAACRKWCTSRCVPPGPGESDCVCTRSDPN